MYIWGMNSKLFRGSLDTIILELLNRSGEMYGYEITQKVKEISKGDLKITEGALYPALHKLHAKGLLSTDVRSIGNRKRKYYNLTEKGKEEVVEQVSEMKSYIQNLNQIFNPQLNFNGFKRFSFK